MRFSRVEIPYEYETEDFWDDGWIQQDIRFHMPGITCSVCGETWSGGSRVYREISDPELGRLLNGHPLPEKEWNELAERVRTELHLSADDDLEPGTIFGLPLFLVSHPPDKDCIEPFPGQLLISASLQASLAQNDISGYRTFPVGFRSCNPGDAAQTYPTYHEIIVTGKALRRDSTRETMLACPHCERILFPNPDYLEVDEDTWDGSDFFCLDKNINIVFVSERLANLLNAQGVSCRPVSNSPLRLLTT